MKIKVIVRTDRVGSKAWRFIDVDDEATEEEISEEASEYALVSGMISIDWQKAYRRLGGGMKIKVIVRTDRVGSEAWRFIDVDDEATEEEISEEASEYALVSGMISIDWQKA